MRNHFTFILLILAFSAPMALVAQEEEKPEESYVYSTYFYCNTSTQERADELIMAHTVPVYDAAVADGTIKGWGWLAHHTGGKWRRILYHRSDSITGLLDAQKTLGERMDATNSDPNNEFGQSCSSHDDYIWKSEAGSSGNGPRGMAGLSVYEECDIAREDRADEIVKTVFAPAYDKAVADGKITSWGWSSHVIGGKYRRLSTMTAANFTDLLNARAELLKTIYDDGKNAEAAEHSAICSSHSDYLWEIQHEK